MNDSPADLCICGHQRAAHGGLVRSPGNPLESWLLIWASPNACRDCDAAAQVACRQFQLAVIQPFTLTN